MLSGCRNEVARHALQLTIARRYLSRARASRPPHVPLPRPDDGHNGPAPLQPFPWSVAQQQEDQRPSRSLPPPFPVVPKEPTTATTSSSAGSSSHDGQTVVDYNWLNPPDDETNHYGEQYPEMDGEPFKPEPWRDVIAVPSDAMPSAREWSDSSSLEPDLFERLRTLPEDRAAAARAHAHPPRPEPVDYRGSGGGHWGRRFRLQKLRGPEFEEQRAELEVQKSKGKDIMAMAREEQQAARLAMLEAKRKALAPEEEGRRPPASYDLRMLRKAAKRKQNHALRTGDIDESERFMLVDMTFGAIPLMAPGHTPADAWDFARLQQPMKAARLSKALLQMPYGTDVASLHRYERHLSTMIQYLKPEVPDGNLVRIKDVTPVHRPNHHANGNYLLRWMEVMELLHELDALPVMAREPGDSLWAYGWWEYLLLLATYPRLNFKRLTSDTPIPRNESWKGHFGSYRWRVEAPKSPVTVAEVLRLMDLLGVQTTSDTDMVLFQCLSTEEIIRRSNAAAYPEEDRALCRICRKLTTAMLNRQSLERYEDREVTTNTVRPKRALYVDLLAISRVLKVCEGAKDLPVAVRTQWMRTLSHQRDEILAFLHDYILEKFDRRTGDVFRNQMALNLLMRDTILNSSASSLRAEPRFIGLVDVGDPFAILELMITGLSPRRLMMDGANDTSSSMYVRAAVFRLLVAAITRVDRKTIMRLAQFLADSGLQMDARTGRLLVTFMESREDVVAMLPVLQQIKIFPHTLHNRAQVILARNNIDYGGLLELAFGADQFMNRPKSFKGAGPVATGVVGDDRDDKVEGHVEVGGAVKQVEKTATAPTAPTFETALQDLLEKWQPNIGHLNDFAALNPHSQEYFRYRAVHAAAKGKRKLLKQKKEKM